MEGAALKDYFETIEIDEAHRNPLLAEASACKRHFERLHETSPVRQAGEKVALCLIFQLFLGLPPGGNIEPYSTEQPEAPATLKGKFQH